MTRIETVSIVYQHPNILLGKKKKKLGAGRYNGFGGGIEPEDRDIYDTAIRETKEEIGITLTNIERMGRILFKFQSDEQDHDVHFFRTREYLGTPRETDEMTAEWFHIDNIPYNQMWATDKHWLPIMLEDKYFLGEVTHRADHSIAKKEIEKIDTEGEFRRALEGMVFEKGLPLFRKLWV